MPQLLYRQASNTLSHRIRINVSPFSVWVSISSSSMEELMITHILFDETLWIFALQSEPLWIKQLAVRFFGQARFFKRQSHCSDLIKQYTGLNCVNDDNMALWTNMTLLYFSSIPCRVHAIRIQHCWCLQY